MNWEAYRWTAKSPSELYRTLGPHGVDHLVRQMLDACWRKTPEETRTIESVKKLSQEVVVRNLAVWSKIKQPSPQAFFENLPPTDADQFFRQAMVVCWMMMPRTGGRKVADVRAIVSAIYQRNIDAWNDDDATFTGKRPKPKKPATPRPAKRTPTRSAAKPARKATPRKRKAG